MLSRFQQTASCSARLFVHCTVSRPEYALVARALDAPDCFPERALLLAGAEDVVLVNREVERGYLEYLHSVGIGPNPDRVVVVESEEQTRRPLADRLLDNRLALRRVDQLLGAASAVEIHPFMLTDHEWCLAGALEQRWQLPVCALGGSPSTIAAVNQKHIARSVAVALGLPVAPGQVVEVETDTHGILADGLHRLADAVETQLAVSPRVIVRGSLGTTGATVLVVNRGNLHECVARLRAETGNRFYLVESMLDLATSPNVCMFIDPLSDTITCVGVADQRLQDSVQYCGNTRPTTAQNADQMVAAATRFCEYLRADGVTGHLGFDFGELASDDGFVFIEINPRINGADYSHGLLRGLNRRRCQQADRLLGSFHTFSLTTSARSFVEFRDAYGHLFYEPGAEAGIVPFKVGALASGQCTVAAVGLARDQAAHVRGRFAELNETREGPLAVANSPVAA